MSPTKPSLMKTRTQSSARKTTEESHNVLGSARQCRVIVNRLQIPPVTLLAHPGNGRDKREREKGDVTGDVSSCTFLLVC